MEHAGDSVRVEMLDLERHGSIKAVAAGTWASVFHVTPSQARREEESQAAGAPPSTAPSKSLATAGKRGVLLLDELVSLPGEHRDRHGSQGTCAGFFWWPWARRPRSTRSLS